MRTVVQVSPAEVVRMVASLVMQRPENMGKCSGALEMHNGPQGITEVRVVIFDTIEEALAYGSEVKAGTAGAATEKPAGAVLQLLAGGKTEPAPAVEVPSAP